MNCFVPILQKEWYIKVKTLQTSEILLQLASIGMVYNTDFVCYCGFVLCYSSSKYKTLQISDNLLQ